MLPIQNVLSVTELNEYVRRLLASDVLLRSLEVEGEISGYKHHISGHRYFALKDAGGRVQCVMFRQNAMGLDFTPTDGMRVRVRASASLYAKDGSYQLYVSHMEKCGIGDLYIKFEQLKKKLEKEGLFDPSIKRNLPAYPRYIGIATSPTGAAVRDMIRVSRRRNPNVGILIAPCAVQGSEAAGEIVRAIERLNADGRSDVLFVGRGGGSIEDLWAFNEEIVARAIAASKIPVISCVGHETDFTIADFVADVRAATPSMAAELAVPMCADLRRETERLMRRIGAGMRQANRLRRLELTRMYERVQSPIKTVISERREKLSRAAERFERAEDARLKNLRTRLERTCATLSAIDPTRVLERGYAYIRTGTGIAASVRDMQTDMNVQICMRDGTARARIEEISTEVEQYE